MRNLSLLLILAVVVVCTSLNAQEDERKHIFPPDIGLDKAGTQPATAPTTVPVTPMPHWEALEQRFKAMSGNGGMAAPFGQLDALQQLVATQKIGDQELAAAVLRFVAENRSPYSILVVSGAMMVARNSVDLAAVWTAALGSKEDKERTTTLSLLGLLELRQSERPNYAVYKSLLSQNPDQLPLPLVVYMYHNDPGQAFLALVGATRNVKKGNQREIELLYAHHMIEHAKWLRSSGYKQEHSDATKTAIEELSKLADAPEWWVRYYAAKMVAERSEFRSDAIVQKFATEKHEAVRTIAQGLVPKKLPTATQP